MQAQKAMVGILFVIAALTLRATSPDKATFSLVAGDVTEATIGSASGVARLKVTLTPEKSAELAAFTARHVNQQVKIMVGGKLRSEPFIREQMAGSSMEIYVTSPADALATVKTLMTTTVSLDQLPKWTDSSGQTHYALKPPTRATVQPPVLKPAGEDRNPLQSLQGSWVVTNATMNCNTTRETSLWETRWTFEGNELRLQSPQEGQARFTLRLDTKAEPKAFHVTPVEPKSEVSGWMLFLREGENLKLAFYDNLQGRPEGFEPVSPRAEPELVVITLAPKR
jgi:uncharacterized protein (TIGR03067 family)